MYAILQWGALPTLLLAACAFAWCVGAPAERYAGLLILVANFVADILLAVAYPAFPSASMCLVDFLLACGLLIAALRYSNYWLGVAMLLQSGALGMQALDFAGDGPSVLVHIIANNAISYAMVGCLFCGAAVSWRIRLKGDAGRPHAAASV